MDVVYDLFCGTGTIGLTLAASCSSVYGFEVRFPAEALLSLGFYAPLKPT